MARPKDADTQETRNRILQAACELVADSNESLSIRAVARKADVSVGTLQYHFVDKRALMNACVDTVYEKFGELLPTLIEALSAAANSNELITRAVEFGFKYCRENSAFIRVLEVSIVENGGLDLARQRTIQGPFIDHVSRLLSEGSNLPEQEIRLRINSISMLIGRYSVFDESALAQIFTPAEGETVLDTVQAHLISSALCLLGVAG